MTKLSWPFGKTVCRSSLLPLVSFTFDDAPLSAFVNGGAVLEHYGFRGTYYISAGLMETMTPVGRIADLQTVRSFRERGHEIGNHTHDHVNCTKVSFLNLVKNIGKNHAKLSGIGSRNFAYPFGAQNNKARIVAALSTRSARGITPGINRDFINLTDLKATRIYASLGLETCLELVHECVARGGWLIFYTHDVHEKPSKYGCTPLEFERIVRSVVKRGIPVRTVDEALAIVLATDDG